MTAGAPSTVALPAAMRDWITAHATTLAPRECCGIISGRSGDFGEVIELTNVEPGIDRYRVDDTELFHIYQALDQRGDDLVAIYHSHPNSPAYPSATDVDLAVWSEVVYLVCSLERPDHPSLRAFRIVGGTNTELSITLT